MPGSFPNSTPTLIANLYAGNGQANGNDKHYDQPLWFRYPHHLQEKQNRSPSASSTTGARLITTAIFNLTFPLQLIADLSTEIGKPDWFIMPSTKIGVREPTAHSINIRHGIRPSKPSTRAGNWVLTPMPSVSRMVTNGRSAHYSNQHRK